jgi:hypothetical protein
LRRADPGIKFHFPKICRKERGLNHFFAQAFSAEEVAMAEKQENKIIFKPKFVKSTTLQSNNLHRKKLNFVKPNLLS